MKFLLFSTFVALVTAIVIAEGESRNGEDQKPGMCFEDYMRTHPAALEKLMQNMSNKSCDHGAHRHGHQHEKKDRHHPKGHDGSHPHGMHEMDFSKLKSCSADRECEGKDKCCRTMCGMRCTRPMFEHHKKEEQGNLGPASSNNQHEAAHEY